jgi:hypothetical protein
MHAALEVNFPNDASALVATIEIVGAIDSPAVEVAAGS